MAQSTQDQGVPAEDQDIDQFQCPHTHRLEDSDNVDFSDYFLSGTVGKKTVRMYLQRGGAGVVGLFYFVEGDWTPVLLGGEWKGETIELATEDKDDKPTGHLSGKFVADKLTGNLIMADSKNSEPVHLAVASAPKCDGSGPWIRFEDPNSSLSFSYPASWKLKNDGGDTLLVCPNPETMAYGPDVTISAGFGAPDVDDLMRCPEGWKYGADCECGKEDSENRVVTCPVPERKSNRGATILNLDYGEWRLYCIDGGYVGQGDGEVRVVVLGNRWIKFEASGEAAEVVDRLSESVRLGKPQKSDRPATATTH